MRYAAILFALAMPAAAHAQDDAQPCPGFANGPASPALVDRFYGGRAVEILRFAMAQDRTRLAALVSPRATAEVWSGDAGIRPRSAIRGERDPFGADAVIGLVDQMAPRSYSFTLSVPGPVSVAHGRCAWEVTLLLVADDPNQAISMRFKFEDGMLVAMIGQEVGLIQGKLP